MKSITLNVQGMSCGHCVNSVESNVGELPGVDQVKVNLAEGKVDVVFDEEKTSLDQIIEVIDDQGYSVA